MSEPLECEWLPVVGYEGQYLVSSDGRVLSAPKRTRASWLEMTPTISRRGGYPVVSLSDGSRRIVRGVHVLVAEAFLGVRPAGMYVLHADDDPTNCHVSNLRWGTPGDNLRDMVRNGRHAMARKTHCKRGHEFTEDNTWVSPSTGGRTCRSCQKSRSR